MKSDLETFLDVKEERAYRSNKPRIANDSPALLMRDFVQRYRHTAELHFYAEVSSPFLIQAFQDERKGRLERDVFSDRGRDSLRCIEPEERAMNGARVSKVLDCKMFKIVNGRAGSSGDPIRVGRAPGRNDLVLDYPQISSCHAAFQFISGRWHVFDNDSTNGTYLNGARLDPKVLCPLESSIEVALSQTCPFIFVDALNLFWLTQNLDPDIGA